MKNGGQNSHLLKKNGVETRHGLKKGVETIHFATQTRGRNRGLKKGVETAEHAYYTSHSKVKGWKDFHTIWNAGPRKTSPATSIRYLKICYVPRARIEPASFRLQVQYYTTTLQRHVAHKKYIVYLYAQYHY